MKFRNSIQNLIPWAILFFLGCTLIVLYVLSTHISDRDRVQVELKVRELLTLNTDINLDILRLRYRQLRHYDTLTGMSQKMDSILDDLRMDFEKVDLPHTLDSARREWGYEQTSLEDFKKLNSVLVNSIFHFVNLTEKINNSSQLAGSNAHAHLFNSVAHNVLIFINEQQSRDISSLLAATRQLEKQSEISPEPLATQERLLAIHGRQIVNYHLPTQSLMRRISNSNFPRILEQSYVDYLEAYNQKLLRAEFYRQMMAVFSFLMIIAVVWIMLRLRNTAMELARSHALLDNVADHLGEGILSFDSDGRLNFINRRAEQFFGCNESELIGTNLEGFFAVGENAEYRNGASFQQALEARMRFEGEEWLLRANGERFPAFFLGGPLPAVVQKEGKAAGYVTSFRDISAQYEAEARLRLALRIFDNLSEALIITDPEGVIQSVNPAFTVITGYSETDARGHTPGSILSSGLHDKKFFEAMWQSLHRDGKWQGEIINRRKNGETFPEWLSITALRDKDNKVLQYISLFSDLSERKQIESHIHHLAYHDPLTNLANRLLFNDRLSNAIQQAHRTRRPLAVMHLDLDHFKHINDSLGHTAGDMLLKTAANRLLPLLREGDTLARVGGDEFALLLPEISSHADAATQANRMLRVFENPFNLNNHEVFVATSIGIAVYPSDGESLETLLKHADVALHNAKEMGRGIFRFFMEGDDGNSVERLELETALRHSVMQNELRLYYQPQVHADTGLIYGVEALVRWQHPTRGLLAPDSFIPLAEMSGYIETLGSWCLQTACRQLVTWQKMGLPIQRMAVNVSARQLSNSGFVDMVLNTIQETGIPSSCLELELTESSLISDANYVSGIFSELRQAGIRIAIDDFGTGYSSLSYLSRYPVDVIKIDKSFVMNLGTESDSRSVIQAIILMAHAMGMQTIAEGVETDAQGSQLLEMGCDLLQGYFYSRPCPPEQVVQLPCVVDV